VVQKAVAQRRGLGPAVFALTQAAGRQFATVAERLEFLLNHTGYMAWLKQQPDAEEREANIAELFNVASVYADTTTFLETVALLTDIDTTPAGSDRVTCMTLHAAKGLEFPMVFIVGCEEGLLPHLSSLNSQAEIEEERRLLYVGMTRAQEALCLSYARQRFWRGQRIVSVPSRFLAALPAEVEREEAWEEGVDAEAGEELIDYVVPHG
jgi:DNA helicase-2/ATP-dependent DNA helicase PcrA